MINGEFGKDFLMRLEAFGINPKRPNLNNHFIEHNKKSYLAINFYKNTLKAFNGESFYRILSLIKVEDFLIDTHAHVNEYFVSPLSFDRHEVVMDKLKDDLYITLDIIDKSMFKEGSTIILIQYNDIIFIYNEYEFVEMYSSYSKHQLK